MAKSAGKKVSEYFIWILMAMLVVGLMGFGTTQFSHGVDTVATVGEREVDVNDYARALDNRVNELSRQIGTPLTLEQANTFGASAQVLRELLGLAALDNETDNLGVSAGDDRVSETLQGIAAFQNASGEFDPVVYRESLNRVGMNVSQFESRSRDEIARNILQSGVFGGLQGSETAAGAVVNFLSTEFDATQITLTTDSLDEPIGTPSVAELQAFFAEVGEDYVVPQTRQITYAWVTPAMLVDTVDVSEDTLRAMYDSRSDQYIRPERRLVERIVFEDDTAADGAAARVASGELTFEELVAERGLDLASIDMGDVTREALGDAADAVFAIADTGGLARGPSVFGPALYRVNGILYATETAFEDVRDALHTEEALKIARDVIADMIEVVDDLLAGGAALDEVAAETDLELDQIAYNANTVGGIANYADFRLAASDTDVDGFPEVLTLEDGGIFALNVTAIEDPRPMTFEEAQPTLTTELTEKLTVDALEAQAAPALAAMEAGGDVEALGFEVQTLTEITRTAAPPGLSQPVFVAILEMEPGEVRQVRGPGSVHVVRLDATRGPDAADETVVAQRAALLQELARGTAQDLFQLYTAQLQRAADVSINQAAINAVHTQLR